MCWLNDKRLETAYPALWEVAEHMYALAYELNKRIIGVCTSGGSAPKEGDLNFGESLRIQMGTKLFQHLLGSLVGHQPKIDFSRSARRKHRL